MDEGAQETISSHCWNSPQDQKSDIGKERRTWFREMVLPHENWLRSKMLRHYRVAHEIDDLVQDIFVNMLRLESVAHIHSPKSYLWATGRSILMQQQRRRAIAQIDSHADMEIFQLACEAPLPDRIAEDRQSFEHMCDAVAALPERRREILVKRRMDGLTIAETALAMNLADSTVEQNLRHALSAVRQQLAA
jgi:RNA polymerase sigma factor (sigma-70 family)